MNLKQLEVFVAVAETGSFSKGAEVSFLTQSTVSQHVAALEVEFGVKLLDRTARGACPTEGGKLLLRQARQLLAEAQEIRRTMDRYRGLDDATLTIGASSIPGDYLIPAVIPRLLGRFPGLKLILRQGDSRDILSRIVGGEVEVGVVGSRFDEQGCTFVPICRDDIRLIAGKGHRWHGREIISLRELQEEPMILRASGSGTGDAVVEALRRSGMSSDDLKVRAWLGSNEAVKRAVAAGAGVSFLSVVSVRSEIESGEMAAITVEGMEIGRQFYLASRSGREHSPAATVFAEVMLQMESSPPAGVTAP